MDFEGGIDNGAFYLRNCGFFSPNTPYGTPLTRPAIGVAPDINLDSLP
jgi:hypothetical protein